MSNNVNSNINITSNIINNSYKDTNKGPFYVYVDNIHRNRIHPMAVGKITYNSNYVQKKYVTEIKSLGYARVRVRLDNFAAANELLKLNSFKNNELQAYIPNSLVHRQGVIGNIDINESEDDLTEAIISTA